MNPESAAAANAISYWPLGVLAIGIAFVVIAIAVLRMHAFLRLHRAGKTWTVPTTFISVVGLVEVLIVSSLLPLQ